MNLSNAGALPRQLGTMDPHARLFGRFRDHGDVAALGEVFDRCAPSLLSVALHLCSDPGDAEDILQETFLTAMKRASSFDSASPLAPWMAGLLRNVARNRMRHGDRRRTKALPELAGGCELEPGNRAERDELIAKIRTSVEEFPEAQRQVALLHLLHGLSPIEIAEATGITPGAVRVRLMRALRRLRTILPAGLSVAVIGVSAGRGMAAVRRAVLSDAEQLVAVGSVGVGTAIFGGVLAMKKLIGAVAVVLVLIWALAGSQELPQPDVAEPIKQGATPVLAGEHERPVKPDASRVEAAIDGREPTGGGLGAIRIRLRTTISEQPIAGASIQAWPGEAPVPPFVGTRKEGTTDATGEIPFGKLAPGVWHVLHPSGPDSVAHRVVVEPGNESLCELTLAISGTVTGRVIDAQGNAVPRAEVWVSKTTGVQGRYGGPEPINFLVRRAAITDRDGQFEFGFAPDERIFSASHPEHVSSRSQPLRSGKLEHVTLELRSNPATIRGILYAPDGAPVRNALVRLRPAGQDYRRTEDGDFLGARLHTYVRTGAGGRFEFGGLGAGMHRVRVGSGIAGVQPLWREVNVKAGDEMDLELRLAAGSQVYGRVVTSDGEGVYARVRLTPYKDHNGHYSDQSTRPDGSFYLPYAPTKPFSVQVQLWRGASGMTRHFEKPNLELFRSDFVLEDYATLRGVLLDEGGQPLPGWTIHGPSGFGQVRQDGSFRVIAPKDGPQTLRAHPPSGSDKPIAVFENASFGTEIEFRIPDASRPGAVLTGVVTAEGDVPLAGVELALRRDSHLHQTHATGRTDLQGRFRFETLPAGSYTIWVAAHGFELRKFGSVALEHREVRAIPALSIPLPARLRVEVSHADGRPWLASVPYFQVMDAFGARVDARRVDPGDGRHLSVSVEAGSPAKYVVKLRGTDLLAADAHVELARGKEATVKFAITITRSREITFNYAGADGFNEERMMKVELRDATGKTLYAEDISSRYRSPRGYHYWTIRQKLHRGRYEVSGRSATGTAYHTWFTVGDDIDEPTRIDVPKAR